MAPPGLVDQYGRPIDTSALEREEAAPSLSGIRQIISDHPAADLTPQRLARLLRDAEQGDATAYLELAEDIEERDLHYLGVIGTRKRQVAQLEITVEAASDKPDDIKNADLVRQVLEGDDVEDALFDMLDAVGKGYSATEILWEMSERDWRPRELVWRDPRWFAFSRADGRTLKLRAAGEEGAETDHDAGLKPLSPFKFIVHRARAKSGLPIRGGLARAAAWAYFFRNIAVKDWAIFCEVYGQPLRVGKYHQGATDTERRTLLRAVKEIGSDAAAIIPATMQLELLGDNNRRDTGELYERLSKYLEQQISKAVLGQTATTDAIAGGHAVSREHNEVREDIERSDARQLAATLMRDLARPLIDLNRGPQAVYPNIRIGRPAAIDIKMVTDALPRLVPMGLRVQQSEIRDMLGLADPEEGAELLMAPAAPAGPTPTIGGEEPDNPAEEEPELARQAAEAPRDAVDALVDRLAPIAGVEIDAMIERVRPLVDRAGSLEELADGLAALYPELRGAGLAEAVRQAMALAHLVGRDEIGG